MSFHIFGDSHVQYAWSDINNIYTHALWGSLCYSFGRDMLSRLNISNPEYGVKENDSVCFLFGEIDCRSHIRKYVTDDVTYMEIIDPIIYKYFEGIKLNAELYKHVNIYVCSIAPAVEKNKIYVDKIGIENGWLATTFNSSDDERKQYVHYFNKKLKEFCNLYNYTFINIHDYYTDANGFLNRELSCPSVHIKDPKFIIKYLSDNNIAPSMILNNTKCTLIGHNGWTDFFSQYPLYREKISKYKDVIIFVNEASKIPLLKALYPEDTIRIEVPPITNIRDGYYTCITCHTLGSSQCHRGESCKFINYSNYIEYDNIKLNAFDNYHKWSLFMEGKSFLDAFYEYYNLNFIDTIKANPFIINREHCKTFYDSLSIHGEYIVIHNTNEHKFSVNNKDNLRIINLDSTSKIIVDTVMVLEGAKELHLLDSVYGFFVLFLQINYNLFTNHKIYLYYRSTNTNDRFYAIKRYIPDTWVTIHI